MGVTCMVTLEAAACLPHLFLLPIICASQNVCGNLGSGICFKSTLLKLGDASMVCFLDIPKIFWYEMSNSQRNFLSFGSHHECLFLEKFDF